MRILLLGRSKDAYRFGQNFSVSHKLIHSYLAAARPLHELARFAPEM